MFLDERHADHNNYVYVPLVSERISFAQASGSPRENAPLVTCVWGSVITHIAMQRNKLQIGVKLPIIRTKTPWLCYEFLTFSTGRFRLVPMISIFLQFFSLKRIFFSCQICRYTRPRMATEALQPSLFMAEMKCGTGLHRHERSVTCRTRGALQTNKISWSLQLHLMYTT